MNNTNDNDLSIRSILLGGNITITLSQKQGVVTKRFLLDETLQH